MTRITCPRNPGITIEHPLLAKVDKIRVEAALIRYYLDGGEAPGDFDVREDWFGRRGLTIFATVNGEQWGLQL